jgi:hypothetical protein
VPLGRGEPDIFPLPDDALGGQVDNQVAERDPGQVLGGSRAPDRRPHPGQQFLHAERLRDIVIGAGVERFHLVHAVGPAGQHDDRGLGPAAQALDHLHPVQVGQAEIEDHQVGRVAAGHLECLGSGRRDMHVVVPHPQVDPQGPQDLRFIVDDQHSCHWLDPPADSRSR